MKSIPQRSPLPLGELDPMQEEIERLEYELHHYREAYDEWQDKTEWVQETAQPHELGMHRADVLKQRIQKLGGQVA